VLKAMESDAGIKIEQLRVDGGAVVDNLLMQFQADIMGVRTVRPQVTESTALVAVKFWKDEEEVAHYWKTDREFIPEMPQDAVQKLLKQWKKAIKCAQAWEEHE
jgi:glycerol kinase